MSEKVTVSPTPTEEEMAAITACLAQVLNQANMEEPSEVQNNWRFSNRWWVTSSPKIWESAQSWKKN